MTQDKVGFYPPSMTVYQVDKSDRVCPLQSV
jgi:hypothetical protein